MQLDMFNPIQISFGSGFCTNGSGIATYPVCEVIDNVETLLYVINLDPEYDLPGQPTSFLFGENS